MPIERFHPLGLISPPPTLRRDDNTNNSWWMSGRDNAFFFFVVFRSSLGHGVKLHKLAGDLDKDRCDSPLRSAFEGTRIVTSRCARGVVFTCWPRHCEGSWRDQNGFDI